MKALVANRRRSAGVLVASVGLVVLLAWIDRGSLERANRLYRAGREAHAAELYRARTESRVTVPEALYNLGTVLLRPPVDLEAEGYLRLATESGDSATVQRGHYNLGIHLLLQIEAASDPDSWVTLLGAAIQSNRRALRLDPRDEDARWNLAFSQLVFDEMTRAQSPGEAADSSEEESRQGADEGLVIPEPGQGDGRPPPTEGNREALAGEDPGDLLGPSSGCGVVGGGVSGRELVGRLARSRCSYTGLTRVVGRTKGYRIGWMHARRAPSCCLCP